MRSRLWFDPISYVSVDFPISITLARLVLTGAVRAREFQRMAIALIEGGHECQELHDLAWDPAPTINEAEHFFQASLAVLGLPLPSRAEAAEILMHHYVAAIAARTWTPGEGLDLLMRDVYWPELAEDKSAVCKQGVGDFQQFVLAYWTYDDLCDAPDFADYEGFRGAAAFEAFDEKVRRTAVEWLAKHRGTPWEIEKVGGSGERKT